MYCITLDKKLNSLIYKTVFYISIYGSYKLLKTVRFLAHPVHIRCLYNSIFKSPYVIKRHSVTLLMTSLEFIKKSNRTLYKATKRNFSP